MSFIMWMLSIGFGVSCNNSLPKNERQVISCGNIMDTVYNLSLNSRSFTKELLPEEIKKRCRFVKIQISNVYNPAKHYLAFEVNFLPVNKEKILLGAFSLFPADNPGVFIVSTKGLVNTKGKLLVTMITPDGVPLTGSVMVTVKQIALVNE